MLTRTTVILISAALALSGCTASSDRVDPAQSQSTDGAPALTGTPVRVEVSGTFGTEPVLSITAGDPVTELEVTDLVVGTGDAVPAGATVTADYVGYGAASSQMFDSSWVRAEPATFPLPNVILGWQEGLVGMQVGGRRLLVIPAELGYGDKPPAGSGIAAGETLIFVVDLVSFE